MTFVASGERRPDTPEARRYNRIRRRLSIADFIVGVGFLVVLLAAGWSATLHDLALRLAGGSYGWGLVVFVFFLVLLIRSVGLPLDIAAFRLEHRFRLSNQGVWSWVADQLKALMVGLAISIPLAWLLYWTIREWPQHWWLLAWGLFTGFSLFFAQIAPVVLFPLFYRFKPLGDEELKSRLLRLSERAGTRVRGVYEWTLSEKSKKANAALMGLGATRRIVLADTLLEKYSHDEIEAILAHELGHHVHRHIPKAIALQMGISLVGFWAAARALGYAVDRWSMFTSIEDFAALPLLLLVSTGLSFILAPALNAYSRHNERQADLYSWQSLETVDPFISSMNKLAEQNLAERRPSRLVEILFHSHPPVDKRISAALSWAAGRR